LLAAVMAICMLSLAGVPPLAGFSAKFYIFQAAVSNRLVILAVIGVLASVVSAYYYLRVIVVMYMQPENDSPVATGDFFTSQFASAVFAAAVIVIGLFPQPLLEVIYKTFSEAMVNVPIH
jgi:NADH-quinone oxidoreductase subunit N